MKIDMHCHVKEGSIDSKVGLDEYITILKQHGFHWSRMEKAWQREFNLNCIKATNIILEEFNEM